MSLYSARLSQGVVERGSLSIMLLTQKENVSFDLIGKKALYLRGWINSCF